MRKKRSEVLLATLFLTESSSGAVDPRGVRLLAQLSKDVRRKGAVDGTVYGTAATSTRSFFFHHLSAVAAGVKHADAPSRSAPENAAASLTASLPDLDIDTRSANRAAAGAP